MSAATVWRRGVGAWRVSVAACLAGLLIACLLAPAYAAFLSAFAVTVPFNDSQGAMATLPAFQAGFYVALSIATMAAVNWRSFAKGLAVLVVVQAAAFAALHAVSAVRLRRV